MESQSRHSTHFWQGFLSIGVLWGIAIGYAIADFCSGSRGMLWWHGSYEGDKAFVTACILIGPGIGLLMGMTADYALRRSQLRSTLLAVATKLLWFFAICYFLFAIFAGVQPVRE